MSTSAEPTTGAVSRRAAVRDLAARRPVVAAVAVTLGFALALACWPVLFPLPTLRAATAGWPLAGLDATRIAVAVALLTATGWWGVTGFTRGLTWSTLRPFLPLLLLPGVPLVFGRGVAVPGARTTAITVVTLLAVGFGEEAVFRGIVLRTLEPRGRLFAATGSAALFGAFHLVNLATGANPIDVGFQLINTALIGFAFAATALVTARIWPLVVIHAGMDLAYQFQASVPLTVAATSTSPDIAGQLIGVGINAVIAGYGYWLLRRR